MRPFASVVAAAGLSLFVVAGAAHADIFHCVDRNGRSAFRDTPCPEGTRTYGVTYAPAEQPAPEPQRPTPEELARIHELELEVAQLRAWLQAAQAAPVAPAVVQPAPVQEAALEPVYPAVPVVIVVPGCRGRDCKPNHYPHHDGDGHHHGAHENDGHHGRHDGDGRVPVKTPRANAPS